MATLTTPTPTLVPDLGKLAYAQGGDIWGKTLPKGEPQRLTGDGCNREPRWSPSAERAGPGRAQPQSTPVPRPQETAAPPPAWATYTSLAFGVNSREGRGKPSDLMRWSDEALDVELCLADHTWDNFCSSDPG